MYRNEAAFWVGVKRQLINYGFETVWKVPAELRKGLPDAFVAMRRVCPGAWVELKYARAWPVRATTGLLVELTVEQLAHLREARAGGVPAFLLLGVADEWFLMPPTDAMFRATRAQLTALPMVWFDRGLGTLPAWLSHAARDFTAAVGACRARP